MYDRALYAKVVQAVIYIFKKTYIRSSTCIQNGSKTIFEGYVMLLYTNDAGT